jgi:4-amino-4-deoxy-L-arabinose transferase-like glycosyltransferase
VVADVREPRAALVSDRPSAVTTRRGNVGRTQLQDRRWFWSRLAVVVAFAFGVRVVYLAAVTEHFRYGFDAIWYELQGGFIKLGFGYIDPSSFFRGVARPTANFPPLYPLLLAGVAEVHRSELAFQLAGCVIGSVLVVSVGMLGRRVAGARVGLVAAALAAVYPLLIAADVSLMADSLYVVLVTTAVLATYWALDRLSLTRWALLGILLGAAALTRAEGLFFAFVLVIPAAVFARSGTWRRRLGVAAVALGCCLVVMTPWWLRNESVLGNPMVVSTNSSTTLAGANCDATYSGSSIGLWSFGCVGAARFDRLGEVKFAQVARSDGLDYASHHLIRLPVVAAARVARGFGLWDPIAQTHSEQVESRWFPWQLAGWAVYIALLPFAIGGLVVIARRRSLPRWPLFAPIVTAVLVLATGLGSQRFRLPAEPVLIIAAVVGMREVWRTIRGRALIPVVLPSDPLLEFDGTGAGSVTSRPRVAPRGGQGMSC